MSNIIIISSSGAVGL